VNINHFDVKETAFFSTFSMAIITAGTQHGAHEPY
jgi:hypothetical protein